MKNLIIPILTLTLSLIALTFSSVLFFSTEKSLDVIYNSEFQAVFLVNGQVYFGKIEKSDKNLIILNNAHYIQLDTEQTINNNTEIKLIKVGGEIHSPEPRLYINQQSILLIQELKSPSQIVDKLKESL